MPGRIRADDLPPPSAFGTPPRVFVCGPTGFVETASRWLLQRGYDADTIRTERFGPN